MNAVQRKLQMISLGALAELKATQEVLVSDINDCSKNLYNQDSESGRRAYIRAVFAFIEGTVYGLKQVAFVDSELTGMRLSRAEIIFLLEESYQLSDSGKVKIKPNYGIRISPNLRFVFRTFARIYKITYELKVDDSGWSSFQEALKVRNRLTHPKSEKDTVVSDVDLKYAIQTFEWFKQNVDALVLDAIEGLGLIMQEAALDRAEAALEKLQRRKELENYISKSKK